MVRFAVTLLLLAAAVRAGVAQDDTVRRANDALDRGDAIGAHAIIADALGDAGDRERAHLLRLRGYVEVLLRRHRAATETFREILRLEPNDAYSIVELGGRLTADARFDEAEKLYDTRSDAPEVVAARESLARARRYHAEARAKIEAGRRALLWIGIAAAAVLALLAIIGVRALR